MAFEPVVSFLVPTLNSQRTLALCLRSIRAQSYPPEKIEIVVADGGSSDATREIALEFGAVVVENPLITGEAGKSAALRHASGEIVALVDSDNILVGTGWLRAMLAPFADPNVAGSEPIRFVAEPTDTIIDRYCAIIGANDPFCIFAGVYDKQCAITNRWTGLRLRTEARPGYVVFDLDQRLPTIGANGTLYRRLAISAIVGDYLMDIDVPPTLALARVGWQFAKVDVGIRHLFCADQSAFVRKQTRRVRDFLSPAVRSEERIYPWRQSAWFAIAKFTFACLTIVPLLYQAALAFWRSRDIAAFYHPIACWLTLYVYGYNVVVARGRATDRTNWRQ